MGEAEVEQNSTSHLSELVASLGQWYTDPSEEMGLEALDQYYNSLHDIAKLLDLDLKELGG